MKHKITNLFSGAILGLAVTVTAPVHAGNDTIKNLLKIMHENGQITDDQYQILLNGAKADQEHADAAASKAVAKVEEAAKNLPKITMKGKFKIESQDGQHSIQPIGRIFWDSIASDQDGVDAIGEGSELRRARIGFQAQFFKNWKAKLEYDFAGSDADLRDGWISYNSKFGNGDKYNLKVGQHHVPFGVTSISSSKYMSFIRRPLFADGVLSPSRQVGIAFRVDGDRYLVNAGAFQDEIDGGETHVDGDGARTYSIRVAGTPFLQDKNHLLHIGGSYMYIDNRDDSLRVRQRAITHLDSDRIFSASLSNVDNVNAFNLEAIGVFGPFYTMAEYVNWDVDSDTSGQADTLSAWSVEAGWFFTGESMKYKKGQFSGVSPKSPFMKGGGIGAWQAIARFENLDLNDGTTEGGDGDVLSIGLNWTPVKNVRFMATWNKLVDFDRAGNSADGKEPSALSLRAMVYW